MFGHIADENVSAARDDMIETLQHHGIRDERVLAALRAVPRHRFIPPAYRREEAYGDHPCSIGQGQTISQPFIVAHMVSLLSLRPGGRVLEVGTGCGYQAAVLAELGAQVFTIERISELAAYARDALTACGYARVQTRLGDGYAGWPEAAPFDGIVVACAAPAIPPALVDQLAEGGRLVVPVGSDAQRLLVVQRSGDRLEESADLWVRFVPMCHGVTPGP